MLLDFIIQTCKVSGHQNFRKFIAVNWRNIWMIHMWRQFTAPIFFYCLHPSTICQLVSFLPPSPLSSVVQWLRAALFLNRKRPWHNPLLSLSPFSYLTASPTAQCSDLSLISCPSTGIFLNSTAHTLPPPASVLLDWSTTASVTCPSNASSLKRCVLPQLASLLFKRLTEQISPDEVIVFCC